MRKKSYNFLDRQTDRQTDRNHTVDLLKGVFILFVLITHFDWTVTERKLLLFPFWIAMAVPGFMFLSGYVISLSFCKRTERIVNTNYIVKKLIRFTVPFLIVFVCEATVGFFAGNIELSIFRILKDFIKGGYGPGSYYYPLMIQSIIIFPIMFFIIRAYQEKGLALCIGFNLAFEIFQKYFLSDDIYRLLIFRYVLIIAVGMYVALNCKKKIKTNLMILCFVLGFAYIIAFCYYEITPVITTKWTGTSMFASLYLIPIMVLLLRINLANSVLEYVGKCSYDIFLTQMAYYWIGRDIITKIIPYKWLDLIIGITICLICGILFNKIETPITNKIIRICTVKDSSN